MTRIDPESQMEMVDVLCRHSLAAFTWRVFKELHAGNVEYVPNWHVEAICHELAEVKAGRNKRLVVTMPPRCLKSITTAVAFVAWLLGHDPHCKIIVASYGLDLARKHGSDCRRVMEADWYARLFPRTRLAQRGTTQDELKTTAGGGRKAVSVGGAVTGHGADYIIVDDLLKAGDASSETELLRAQEFIEGSLLSRFDRPAEGRVVAIQQRLHEMDPAGYLLDKGYRHLNLPAIAEEHETIDLGYGRVHRRAPGDLLFPARLDRATLEQFRRDMGSATFNMQYQQNPVAPDGSVLRWEWFKTYEEVGARSDYQVVVQSWDIGTSANPRSDRSVCTTWGFRGNAWFLLDVFRGQFDYPELKKTVLRLADSWEADKVLIEDAASGRPLVQECHRLDRARFRAIRPDKDKQIRFNAACAPVEEGLVHLPREAHWLAEFKRELLGFPRAHYDDQVDSFSQFLNWSKGTGFWRTIGRDHPLAVERRGERLNRARRR